jgi:hypothetical protein
VFFLEGFHGPHIRCRGNLTSRRCLLARFRGTQQLSLPVEDILVLNFYCKAHT